MRKLETADGPMIIGEKTFQKFLDLGPCVRRLFEGGDGFHVPGVFDLSVLSTYGVQKTAMAAILSTMESGDLPLDRATAAVTADGSLRHAAIALGGMPTIEDAINRYEQERAKINAANRKAVVSPMHDTNGRYSWRDLVLTPHNEEFFGARVDQLNLDGYVYASAEQISPDVRILRFRAVRDEASSPGAAKRPRIDE